MGRGRRDVFDGLGGGEVGGKGTGLASRILRSDGGESGEPFDDRVDSVRARGDTLLRVVGSGYDVGALARTSVRLNRDKMFSQKMPEVLSKSNHVD